ncbi:PREDICTED: uncharacterized protein LOC108777081 [Cyphomyrmex costatus]|uniref:uncharacterized protein LOC108777081 n=1 Tax=Cyphomyrmex costatus TaxID=456900 RepID=UPI0008522542|nr:PREDICTED: uncharacterized protein LOC108777081 [Cyphomyrmex costatus]
MRVSHVEGHIEQQLALSSLIGHAYESLIKCGVENVNSQRVNLRLSALKENWDKFRINHEAITLSIKQLEEEDETFETLGRPVNSWDDVLIFTVTQRLDPESVKVWEQTIGSSKELPTWNQFLEFLITRLVTLQNYEKSRTGKPFQSIQNSQRLHFQGKVQDSDSKVCPFCEEAHWPYNCPLYKNKPLSQRFALVKRHRLCYNCFGPHRAVQCRMSVHCKKCAGKHHVSLHRGNFEGSKATAKSSTPSETNKPENLHAEGSTACQEKKKPFQVFHSLELNKLNQHTVLLATALVSIRSSTGHCCQARALIDQGSEISLITERLAQRLHLPQIRSNISLIGVGGKKCNTSRGIVHFQLKPHFESSFECTVPAHVLPRLTTSLPSASSKQESLLHLKDLMVADPEWFQSRQIDLLLGAEVYCQILQEGIIKGPIGSPKAQLTELGWIISGPTYPRVSTNTSSSFHISIDDNLYRLIHKFWEIDEVPSTNTILFADDQACEDHFVLTHSRHKDGRYVVRLPFKRSMTHLGNSRQRAVQIMLRLSRKLSLDSSYSKLYTEFLTEYEELNHMRLIPPHLPEPQHVYYLPHHGVKREQSLTTKLRVVFNGSSPSSSGFSLNDLLHTGAKLQIDLFDVLLWFRQFRYVFSSDMEKMYRQIEVHPHDWDFQRILWCDQSLNLRAYQLTTVTYGLACAPFLALRTIQQLLLDEGSKYPLAASSLQKGRYVDDLFGGADSIEQAQEVVSQLTQLCMAGGFKLKKWSSNQSEILASIPKEEQISCLTVGFDNEAIIQTLGLQWLPSSDLFQFTFNYDINP